jgi:transposase-like protein
MKSLRCPNRSCRLSGKVGAGSIIRFGFYTTKSGKRRRFRCRTCRKTFRSNTATPYHRLQHRRATFDEVATLSVEGLNKSAIARVKRIAWNPVHRWLQKAAGTCRRFNDRKINGAPRRSPRVDSLLLQLRQASQGAEIRTRGPDTGRAGGFDHQAADVQGDLLLDDEFFGAAKHHTCVLRLNHVGQCGRFAPFYGGLATLDGGSTLRMELVGFGQFS